MNDLEVALFDLSDHLDIPETGDATEALTRRLIALEGGHRRSRGRVLLAAAAAVFVLAVGSVAVAPARHAVAGWLGIGAVEVRREAGPKVTTPSTRSTTPTTRPPVTQTDMATARKAVQFEIATPTGEAAPARVSVDRRVPGGLVALTYSHFTLVEIATHEGQPPPLAKLIGGAADVEPMMVHGHAGLWIPAIHTIGYLDRSGQMRSDTVRRSGPVLLWERDGVTYRVEGPHTRTEAQAIADSIV